MGFREPDLAHAEVSLLSRFRRIAPRGAGDAGSGHDLGRFTLGQNRLCLIQLRFVLEGKIDSLWSSKVVEAHR